MLDFRRPKASHQTAPDMTPMIDCVFQLLVFFLLASSFAKASSMMLELPKAAAALPPSDEPITVTLDKERSLYIGEVPVTKETLADILREKLRTSQRQKVTFEADRQLSYEDVLEVLLELEKAGAEQVNLSYEQQ